MKPEELLALQERLEQGVVTQSKKDSIGLNNVHLRIRKTFGAAYGVRVESKEDEGTTVYIRFPKNNRS
jgi:two-component system sensor histidine kinase YesM